MVPIVHVRCRFLKVSQTILQTKSSILYYYYLYENLYFLCKTKVLPFPVMTSNQKRTIYAGGLAEEVDESVLNAAFIPFGDIIDIQIPLDYETEKHRGFAFIEFESAADAAAAIDNMNDSELFGRTIRVNLAKPQKIKEGSTKPVWSEDSWLKEYAGKTLNNEEEQLEPKEEEEEKENEEEQEKEENEEKSDEPAAKKSKKDSND